MSAVIRMNCFYSVACSFQPGQTLYTTPDRLAETIAFQQRLLRQALGGDPPLHTLRPTTSNANASTVAPTDTHADYHTVQDNRQPAGSFEWKVSTVKN